MAETRQSTQVDPYTAIVDAYKDLAFNIALRIVKNKQDAEDIVQESFVKAFNGMNTFRRKSKFSTWFYSIVYNTAISSIRQKKPPAVELDESLPDSLDIGRIESAVHYLDVQDRALLVREAMATLHELDYTVLSLYYYEDMSIKEISKIVDKEKNYVKVLLQRARLKLYNGLGDSIKKELKELI